MAIAPQIRDEIMTPRHAKGETIERRISGAIWEKKTPYALFLRRSAQRFFISSDRRFLPAGVSPPPFFGARALAVGAAFDVAARRSAQRLFIASAMRLRPSGVSLPRFACFGA